jgi:adenylate kinase
MRILFLGPPGSGKGTQCKKLAQKLQLPHISSGDLLREAVANNSPAGKSAKAFMEAGKLVPDNVLIEMFKEKLSAKESAQGFILDGFPRNVNQAESLDALLGELKVSLDAVLNLKIDDKLVSERIAGRRSCKNCGAVYHVKFAPPAKPDICDVCGGQLIQRSDDKESLVKERLLTYRQQTEPLIEYYQARKLLLIVDAEGDPEVIFSSILQLLKVPV